ncbi:hypothetical protein BDP27DRAFT_99995 [Rhodocollybia butyracea]|uniref:Autophagy-related protein 16 domain-containing protein n=1 Tax=Rhodocollybia butyracea TaxID=206335 RepID=A0A9P5UE93_9AGAR|nr:hypothetical protein BDP27DRAFT_99995 [Rhodocollybia butyracea]
MSGTETGPDFEAESSSRAAKAARAKALLKKRQAKKAGTPTTSTPGVASPVSERAFSPVPPASVLEEAEEKRDINDVFAHDEDDTSWLSSLPRAGSPPPAPPPTAIFSTASPPNSADYISPANGLHSLQLQEENTLLKKENKILNAQIEQLRSDRAENALNSLKSEHNALKIVVGQLETTNSSLKSENHTFRNELGRWEAAKSGNGAIANLYSKKNLTRYELLWRRQKLQNRTFRELKPISRLKTRI